MENERTYNINRLYLGKLGKIVVKNGLTYTDNELTPKYAIFERPLIDKSYINILDSKEYKLFLTDKYNSDLKDGDIVIVGIDKLKNYLSNYKAVQYSVDYYKRDKLLSILYKLTIINFDKFKNSYSRSKDILFSYSYELGQFIKYNNYLTEEEKRESINNLMIILDNYMKDINYYKNNIDTNNLVNREVLQLKYFIQIEKILKEVDNLIKERNKNKMINNANDVFMSFSLLRKD